jgi:hypothetical protein
MKLTRGGLAFCIMVSWSIPALADDSAHDKAVAAFQEGRRDIEAGNCDGAVTKLRESLTFEPSVGARLSLADCYEKNDPLAAWKVLKDAANLAYINHDDRLPLAEQRAAALEKRLPIIKLNIPGGAFELPGFELRVDGELVDKFHYRGGIIATKPGKHIIEANAPLRHFSEQIATEIGGSTPVNIKLERETCTTNAPAPAPVAPVVVSNENPGSTRRTLGLAVAGVGVVGLATGAVFGVLTSKKKSDIKDSCGGDVTRCNAAPGSVDPERESAKTTATISTASFIVGGLALVGGGALYFTAPTFTSAATIRVTPRVATNGGGMGLEGTW